MWKHWIGGYLSDRNGLTAHLKRCFDETLAITEKEKEMTFVHEPHIPVSDCDCRECAVSERNRLRLLLAEAAEDIECWGAYASEYFQHKHDLAGCVAKYRMTPNA